jgi:hypothetical protein
MWSTQSSEVTAKLVEKFNIKKIVLNTIHTFIGLIYNIAGTLGGSLGTATSSLTRFELGMPGYVLNSDNFHSYNV